jgi:signal transduction histidine kinase
VIGLRRALWAIGLAGLAAGAGAIALTLGSDHVTDPWVGATLGPLVGWSFIATGVFAWWRRPHERFGPLMVAVGFAWFVGALTGSDVPAVFTAGLWLGSVYVVLCVHLVLAFPHGRLRGPGERRLVAAGYVLSVVGPLPMLLLGDLDERGCACPESAIRIADADGTAQLLGAGVTLAAVALIAAVLRLLVRRRREASAGQRRALAPVLWSAVALIVGFGLVLSADTLGLRTASDVTGVVALAAFASVPYAFLLGILRSGVSRAGVVAGLLGALRDEIGAGDLRSLLADALGDPELELAYRLTPGDRIVDGRGHPVALPAPDDPARTATDVSLDGETVGAIVHDRRLCDDPQLLSSVTAAAGLAMENGRLQAELRARVDELTTSRARLLETGVAERRRLERDLHDGAQQRLVALSLDLRLAQARLHADPDRAGELLTHAQEELRLALAELRELARGIHPAVLSDRGLDAALQALAARSPVPVMLEPVAAGRLPEPVEAAVYFVVAEALANVARHAHATRVSVRIDQAEGRALVEVADDGIGGADPTRGTGLHGLADRLSALDGRLTIESPVGQGTRLRVEIPCGTVSPPAPATR